MTYYLHHNPIIQPANHVSLFSRSLSASASASISCHCRSIRSCRANTKRTPRRPGRRPRRHGRHCHHISISSSIITWPPPSVTRPHPSPSTAVTQELIAARHGPAPPRPRARTSLTCRRSTPASHKLDELQRHAFFFLIYLNFQVADRSLFLTDQLIRIPFRSLLFHSYGTHRYPENKGTVS